MKKIILIPALLLSSLAFATDYNYEVTPVVGYNFAQKQTALDNNELYGGEIQYNGFSSPIKPELSFLYSPSVDFDTTRLNAETGKSYTSAKSDIFRTAINGVYEYDKFTNFIPLAKAGLGYEEMADTFSGKNINSAFADFGVGAKIPFTKQIALKLEALYMLKNNKHDWDNNLALLAGLNIAFGSKASPVVEKTVEPDLNVIPNVPAAADDDNDGIVNTMDQCPNTMAGVAVDANGCALDSDRDGVIDANDKCPNTELGVSVDANGCKYDGDDDNDGVKNSIDQCPNSPANSEVNSEGCPLVIDLHINFDNNSYKINDESIDRVQDFANFLKEHSNYNARVIGYTSNTGAKAYNQKLSAKRANSVKDMLVEDGISADRISAFGMGEENPIASNATAEGQAQNRRIEAELVKE